MTDSGDIFIEIDQDSDVVTISKPSGTYTYTVDELQGKGILDSLLRGGATYTVYSQNQKFTKEEYEELFGEVKK